MRATIKNYLEAEKIRREEEGREGGFSLIELIIVVVILGILVAIAIPIFASIQTEAENRALEAAAANGATAVAAAIAADEDAAAIAAAAASGGSGGADGIVTASTGSTTDVSAVCVQATGYGRVASAGTAPGCYSAPAEPAP